jgi:septum site-determining protein MinC
VTQLIANATSSRPAAILRGSARGLEIVIDATAPPEAIAETVTTRIAEAPEFFRGSDVRIRVEDGPLAAGSLARLDAIAARYELRIVEVLAARPLGSVTTRSDAAPVVQLAVGSAPVAPDLVEAAAPPDSAPVAAKLVEAVSTAVDAAAPVASSPLASAPVADAARAALTTPSDVAEPGGSPVRVVIGPVRSGVILDHRGHLFVFGDVNPGAEVRATGNIVVLGRLRGTAHAGIGEAGGFILALRLEPQQLRIGRSVARAQDAERGTDQPVPEIAHLAGKTIVVERYQGRLPGALAASL